MVNGKTLKKSTYNILVPNERYQDFWHLLQNPKFPKNILGFSNHAQRFTPCYYLDVDNPLQQNSITQIATKLKTKMMSKLNNWKLWKNSSTNCYNYKILNSEKNHEPIVCGKKMYFWQNY